MDVFFFLLFFKSSGVLLIIVRKICRFYEINAYTRPQISIGAQVNTHTHAHTRTYTHTHINSQIPHVYGRIETFAYWLTHTYMHKHTHPFSHVLYIARSKI